MFARLERCDQLDLKDVAGTTCRNGLTVDNGSVMPNRINKGAGEFHPIRI